MSPRTFASWLLSAFPFLPRLVLVAITSYCVACASAPPARVPVLPPWTDVGQLVPPAPGPLVVPGNVARYPDTHVRRNQCPGLPPGILVSPAVYAEQIATASDRKRLAVELDAYERLRLTERQAARELEQACRVRVTELAGQVATAARLAPWKLAGAFVLGVAAGVLFRVGGR